MSQTRPLMLVASNDANAAFVSLNTVTVIAGVAFGSISLPYTPLEFTVKNMEEADYLNFDFVEWVKYEKGDFNEKTRRVSDGTDGYYELKTDFKPSKFYEKWNALPNSSKRHFYGTTKMIKKDLFGLAAGIGEDGIRGAIQGGLKGGLLAGITSGLQSEFKAAIEGIFKGGLKVLVSYLSNMTDFLSEEIKKFSGKDITLQVSNNNDQLLYGLNNHDTFYLDIDDFNSGNSVVVINASIGVVAQLSGNFVLIGNFGSWKSICVELGKIIEEYKRDPIKAAQDVTTHMDSLAATYLQFMYKIIRNAIAVTFYPAAAAGVIFPGISASIVAS